MKNFSPVVANLAPATSATVTGTFDATGKITHIFVAFIVKAQGFFCLRNQQDDRFLVPSGGGWRNFRPPLPCTSWAARLCYNVGDCRVVGTPEKGWKPEAVCVKRK